MTVGEAIRGAADRLAATSDTPRLDAEVLMAHSLGCSRSDMLLRAMRDAEPQAFASLIERRAAHEPVAYITGLQEFYGCDFTVRPGVLIPRGDSETIVRTAIEIAPQARRVLDLGTGSGALLLACLADMPQAHGVGIDASSAAAEIARVNADTLGLADRAEIVVADWHDATWASELSAFDLVLCNPPYVESGATLDPDVRDYEPDEALFAGSDGLADYRVIIPQLAGLIVPGGAAILEIGYRQSDEVSEIAAANGFAAELRRDLAERPRALILRQSG